MNEKLKKKVKDFLESLSFEEMMYLSTRVDLKLQLYEREIRKTMLDNVDKIANLWNREHLHETVAVVGKIGSDEVRFTKYYPAQKNLCCTGKDNWIWELVVSDLDPLSMKRYEGDKLPLSTVILDIGKGCIWHDIKPSSRPEDYDEVWKEKTIFVNFDELGD